MIGVALEQVAARHAVERGQDHLGLEVELGQALADRIGHGGDVDRVVVIGRRHPHRRLPAHVHQRPERLVAGGGRGRGRILRVERHQQDPVAALVEQRLEAFGHLRLAVAHRPVDHDGIAHRGLQALALAAGDGLERTLVPLVVPDAGVVATLRPRALGQDDQVEERPPDQPGHLDDPAVRQELLEIAAHRPVAGALGGAENSSAARPRGPRPPSGGRPEGRPRRGRGSEGRPSASAAGSTRSFMAAFRRRAPSPSSGLRIPGSRRTRLGLTGVFGIASAPCRVSARSAKAGCDMLDRTRWRGADPFSLIMAPVPRNRGAHRPTRRDP